MEFTGESNLKNMKTINKFIRTLLFMTVLIFVSCGSDDNKNNGNNDSNNMNGEFRAKIDGVAFEANKYINHVVRFPPQPEGIMPTLQVVGVQNDNNKVITIDLRVPEVEGVGVYDIRQNTIPGDLNPNGSLHIIDNIESSVTHWFTDYNGNEKVGEINIQSIQNKRIKGTFYVKLKNATDPTDIVNITDGYFDFVYE